MKTFKHHGVDFIEIAANLYGLAHEQRMPAGKRHHYMRAVSIGPDGKPKFRMFPVPQGGSLQTWQETLVSAQADGNNLTASTTATSIIPAAARYTLPANYFAIGKALRLRIFGRLGNIVTTPGTITFDVRMGPTSNIIVFTGVCQMSGTAHTTLPFFVEFMLTCRAIGSGTAANLMGQAMGLAQAFAVTAGTADNASSMAAIRIP